MGDNGKGIRSRWYPETIAERLRQISTLADRFVFGDAGHAALRQHQAFTPRLRDGGRRTPARCPSSSCCRTSPFLPS